MAALFVAVLVGIAAVRLMLQSVDVLMDRSSAEADEQIRAVVGELRGVELTRARVRHAAGRSFVDMVVGVSPDAGVTQAHATADEIEKRVEQALGSADVVVHVEPLTAEGSLRERATVAASTVPEVREIHNVRLLNVDGERELSLHVKMPRDLSLTDAHEVTEKLESAIRADVPEITRVHTHIEPLSRTRKASKPSAKQVAADRARIDAAVKSLTGAPPDSVEFRQALGRRLVMVTISIDGDAKLPTAHDLARDVEAEIAAQCPDLSEIIIHTEPRG
jgi:divalent metal cation (Fe/Co/Zn/Cd) transporter